MRKIKFSLILIADFISDPSADDLKRIMMTNGGVFHHYLNTQKTTHIIATNLPDVKVLYCIMIGLFFNAVQSKPKCTLYS